MKKKLLIIIIPIIIIALVITGFLVYKDKVIDEKITSSENGTKINVDSEEYQVYDNLIYSIIGTNSTIGNKTITNLNVGDKITLSELTEEEIFMASFRYVYTSSELITNEDNSNITFEIKFDSIKTIAKNIYNKSLTILPEKFVNGSESYTASSDSYIGTIIDNGIEDTNYEYFINEVIENNNTYVIVINIINKDTSATNDECIVNEDNPDGCSDNVTNTSLTYKFNYTKEGENYTFVSVERTA